MSIIGKIGIVLQHTVKHTARVVIFQVLEAQYLFALLVATAMLNYVDNECMCNTIQYVYIG